MDDACYGISKLHFLIVNGVAAQNDDILGIHRHLTAGEDLAKNLPVTLLRITDDRQRGYRCAAHGIDIVQGVYRGDMAINAWIIGYRCKEINSLHQRELV